MASPKSRSYSPLAPEVSPPPKAWAVELVWLSPGWRVLKHSRGKAETIAEGVGYSEAFERARIALVEAFETAVDEVNK